VDSETLTGGERGEDDLSKDKNLRSQRPGEHSESSTISQHAPHAQVKPSPCSSARILLKHAGSWKGNDLESRLEEVFANRGEADFRTHDGQ
jgi:hypothetical protein